MVRLTLRHHIIYLFCWTKVCGIRLYGFGLGYIGLWAGERFESGHGSVKQSGVGLKGRVERHRLRALKHTRSVITLPQMGSSTLQNSPTMNI